MLKSAKGMTFIVATLLAALVIRSTPAAAQENPLIGSWSTSMRLLNGGGFAAYVDFYPNGILHLSGVVTGPGQPFHEWGTYAVIPAQSTLQYVYRAYTGAYEPPVNINQPVMVQYQFPSPNEVLFSDGGHWVRAASNPFPDPRR